MAYCNKHGAHSFDTCIQCAKEASEDKKFEKALFDAIEELEIPTMTDVLILHALGARL